MALIQGRIWSWRHDDPIALGENEGEDWEEEEDWDEEEGDREKTIM